MSDNIEWIYLRIEFAAMAMQGLQSHVVYGENDREWIAKESVAMPHGQQERGNDE